MRLTTRTNLALRALMYCGANEGRSVRTRDIATACGVSENHLVQVIHALGRQGFIVTQRGRSGGLRLARPMAEIAIGAVVRALEGGIPFVECLGPEDGTADCPLRGICRLTCVLADAVEAFYRHLDAVSLADLVAGNHALRDQLAA